MKFKEIACIAVLSLVGLSCATPNYTNEWIVLEDRSKARITLNLNDLPMERKSARTFLDREAAGESGVWKGSNGVKDIEAWILVYSLTEKVFSNGSVGDLEEVVRSATGESYLLFDESDQIETRLGPVRIQYYLASGASCFFIESYWGETRSMADVVLRNGGYGDYIIGDDLLRAYYCDSNAHRIQFEDVENFLQAMHIKNTIWPEDRFTEIVKKFDL